MVIKTDLAVIGGGPGGYVAAIRAAQLKKKVVLFEEDAIGGTCMNYGCIPTKHLLHQTKVYKDIASHPALSGPRDQIALNWARVQENKLKVVARLVKGTEFLLQRNGVEVVRGKAHLADERRIALRSEDGERSYEAERIILATGSRPAELPFLKIDGTTVVSSTAALAFEAIPRKMVVVGAGAIGLEIGTIYRRLGTDVTILEMMPTVLPGCDTEMGKRIERLLKSQGLKIATQMKIEKAAVRGGRAFLAGVCLTDGKPFEVDAECVLLAAGRRPNSENLHAGSPVVSLNAAGWVEINDHCETRVPGIYAVGDLVGGKLLAHKASHQGLAAAVNACGGRASVNDAVLPMAVFIEPEFASVGLTEEEARQRTDRIRTGIFTFQANGRALTMNSPEGLVKIVADEDDRILGAHILGPSASDLIAELTLAMRRGLTARDIAETIHIHPTLSEAVGEAALKVRGEAIHALN
jgi:dihydrolipoamide dehydrogenase